MYLNSQRLWNVKALARKMLNSYKLCHQHLNRRVLFYSINILTFNHTLDSIPFTWLYHKQSQWFFVHIMRYISVIVDERLKIISLHSSLQKKPIWWLSFCYYAWTLWHVWMSRTRWNYFNEWRRLFSVKCNDGVLCWRGTRLLESNVK